MTDSLSTKVNVMVQKNALLGSSTTVRIVSSASDNILNEKFGVNQSANE